MTDQNVKQIKKITVIGIVGNLLLAAVKFLVGFLGNSQAVIADAVHSLSDLSTDFAVLIGVKFWTAPPDEKHPYGHHRIEAIVTAIIGIALLFVAFGLIYNALSNIRNPHLIQTSWIAIVGPLISIIVKEVLYRWTILVGETVKSSALIANAWHHRSDALSSIPAVIAVVLSAINPDWAFIDYIGAIIISLFIFKISWDIIKPSFAELTDTGASEKERELIKGISMRIQGVKETHAIRSRKFSSKLFVDLHILVDPEISVREGHNIAEEVQNILIQEGPDIVDVVVHTEPFE